MSKQNCWEHLKCGRHPGGAKVRELGVCPAATEHRTAGINGGTHGGRACWAIKGTFCGGAVQGSFATKLAGCTSCNFYQQVKLDEGRNLVMSKDILARIS